MKIAINLPSSSKKTVLYKSSVISLYCFVLLEECLPVQQHLFAEKAAQAVILML